MFKLSALCAVSVLAIASAAQAQDAGSAFSGYYAGIHAGMRNDHLSGDASFPGYGADLAKDKEQNGIYGGQIGYNFVSPTGLLTGFELSGSLGGSSDSQSDVNFAGSGRTLSYDRKISGLALAQGKLGWVQDKVAVYGLGGVAYSRGKINGGLSDGEGTTYFSGTENLTGWTAGFGADVMLTDTMSIGGSYNFVKLNAGNVSENTIVADQELQAHIAKMVLNFKF